MRPPIEFLFVLLALSASPAWAEGPVRLEWHAPKACSDREVLVERVSSLLGRSLDGPFDRALTITATATVSDDGAHVRIVTIDDAGRTRERSLDGDDCAELLEATALVVAIAIDPAAITWAASEPPPPPAAPPPPPTVSPVNTSTRAIPDRPPPPPSDELRAPDIPFGIPLPRLDFRAGLRADVGVLPEGGLGLSLGGAVLWDPLRFQAAASVWFDRHDRGPGPDVDTSIWSVQGEGCYVVDLGGPFELPICSGLEVGRYAVDPFEERFGPGRFFWAGALLSAGFGVEIVRQLAIIVEAQGILSLTRPAYEFPDDAGVPPAARRVRIGPGGGRVALWFELRVP